MKVGAHTRIQEQAKKLVLLCYAEGFTVGEAVAATRMERAFVARIYNQLIAEAVSDVRNKQLIGTLMALMATGEALAEETLGTKEGPEYEEAVREFNKTLGENLDYLGRILCETITEMQGEKVMSAVKDRTIAAMRADNLATKTAIELLTLDNQCVADTSEASQILTSIFNQKGGA